MQIMRVKGDKYATIFGYNFSIVCLGYKTIDTYESYSHGWKLLKSEKGIIVG